MTTTARFAAYARKEPAEIDCRRFRDCAHSLSSIVANGQLGQPKADRWRRTLGAAVSAERINPRPSGLL